jgi:hypothetical protein
MIVWNRVDFKLTLGEYNVVHLLGRRPVPL